MKLYYARTEKGSEQLHFIDARKWRHDKSNSALCGKKATVIGTDTDAPRCPKCQAVIEARA